MADSPGMLDEEQRETLESGDISRFFEISLDLLVTAGFDGYFKLLNPAWEKVLGWTSEELRQRPYLDFVHPDDRERTLAEVARLKQDQRPLLFTNRYRCKDGSYRSLLWSCVVRDQQFYAAARDITESKEQARLLRETNEMGQIGGWSYDVANDRMSFSEQTYAIFGLPPGAALDYETALCFLLQPGRQLFRERLTALFEQGGDPIEMELEFVSARGRRGWLRIKGKAERKEGMTHRLLGLMQDITDKKATEQRLQEEQARMLHASKMAALGEMAGGIAHEINTPLGVILLRAHQLERVLAHSPERVSDAVSIAQAIGATAEKIACIIRGLRAFARSGEQDPFEMKSLRSILEEATALCTSTFRNSGIQLTVDEIPHDFVLECRPVQVVQVLLNLLSNSKSAVESTLADHQTGWIRIQSEDLGDTVGIRIIDSGPGIPASIRSKMMEPFFTTKKVGEGTGLGLSISKGIVEGHHGRLYFDHDTPHTCFVVELPKRQGFDTATQAQKRSGAERAGQALL